MLRTLALAAALNACTATSGGGAFDGGACRAGSAGFVLPANDLAVPRSRHTATLLCDGRVLVVGGVKASGAPVTAGAFELYDPATRAWSSAGLPSFTAADARADHVAVALCGATGTTVFIAGGADANGVPMDGALTWSSSRPGVYTALANPLGVARAQASALAWSATTVLVAGGLATDGPALSFELYDVAAQLAGPAQRFATPTPRLAPGLAIDPGSGEVVMCGGQSAGAPVASCEELLPLGQAANAPAPAKRGPGTLAFWLSSPHELLVFGGIPAGPGATAVDGPPGAQPLLSARWQAAGAVLGTSVLLAGGLDAAGAALASAELYDAVALRSSSAGSLNAARARFTATALVDGSALLAGGNAPGAPASELYLPACTSDGGSAGDGDAGTPSDAGTTADAGANDAGS